MPDTATPAEIAEYVADYPRTGITVKLYLDSAAKVANWHRHVMVRWIGWAITVNNRHVSFDLADAAEISDAIVCAGAEQVEADGKPMMRGPQISIASFVQMVDKAIAATGHDRFGDPIAA